MYVNYIKSRVYFILFFKKSFNNKKLHEKKLKFNIIETLIKKILILIYIYIYLYIFILV